MPDGEGAFLTRWPAPKRAKRAGAETQCLCRENSIFKNSHGPRRPGGCFCFFRHFLGRTPNARNSRPRCGRRRVFQAPFMAHAALKGTAAKMGAIAQATPEKEAFVRLRRRLQGALKAPFLHMHPICFFVHECLRRRKGKSGLSGPDGWRGCYKCPAYAPGGRNAVFVLPRPQRISVAAKCPGVRKGA